MDDRKLLHAIADRWGGPGCKRADHPSGVFAFRGDEGHSLYYVWRYGQTALLAEDSGRPFKKPVPKGRLIVRCMDDAPDAWWYVEDNGAYTDYTGKTIMLLEEE